MDKFLLFLAILLTLLAGVMLVGLLTGGYQIGMNQPTAALFQMCVMSPLMFLASRLNREK